MRAQTIDAAWQVFAEDERGSIEIGKLADLAILDNNPWKAGGDILSIAVTQTIRRGAKL